MRFGNTSFGNWSLRGYWHNESNVKNLLGYWHNESNIKNYLTLQNDGSLFCKLLLLSKRKVDFPYIKVINHVL